LTRFKLQILELAKKQCQFIANYNKIEEIVIAHLAELSVSQWLKTDSNDCIYTIKSF